MRGRRRGLAPGRPRAAAAPDLTLGRPRPARRASSTRCARSPPALRHRDQRARRVGLRAPPGAAARASTRCSPGQSGHRQDDGRRGHRRRPRASSSTRSTSRRSCRKYIGETEKNLEPHLRRAPRAPTRSCSSTRPTRCSASAREVKDAHDRYANIEVAYLLQRMEAYDGRRSSSPRTYRRNIDDAFVRRLDFVIDFPFPEPPDRERLWRALLPAGGCRWRGTSTSACSRRASSSRAARSATSRSPPRSSPPRRAARSRCPSSCARSASST